MKKEQLFICCRRNSYNQADDAVLLSANHLNTLASEHHLLSDVQYLRCDLAWNVISEQTHMSRGCTEARARVIKGVKS